MTAANPWPAGKYELLATSWDEVTSEVGKALEYVRHVTGDVVTLNAEHAERLGRSGSIIKPGEREKTVAAAAEQQLLAAQAAYDAAMAKMVPDPEPSAAPAAVAPKPTPPKN